eukprot:CAMPEP_0173405440 /NCGR_PEP_ID=MMETSP1356-20130122/61854_1 /TAXON_ID=77927 ORGANISM="Hemiselmis virescens, Strain PCC157" /NCGR_SAMPLE_ID=MMETSP1356 /ASSEMBLY_ACC=CAM_ASM_000847 /LENGTH=69 /DNA_ID=CAMNT_0014366249 /DNA_START=222 /DNA_END=431 /DNA_ORIENTATION=-
MAPGEVEGEVLFRTRLGLTGASSSSPARMRRLIASVARLCTWGSSLTELFDPPMLALDIERMWRDERIC